MPHPDCAPCANMPADSFCLSHTCLSCGQYSEDVEQHSAVCPAESESEHE